MVVSYTQVVVVSWQFVGFYKQPGLRGEQTLISFRTWGTSAALKLKSKRNWGTRPIRKLTVVDDLIEGWNRVVLTSYGPF